VRGSGAGIVGQLGAPLPGGQNAQRAPCFGTYSRRWVGGESQYPRHVADTSQVSQAAQSSDGSGICHVTEGQGVTVHLWRQVGVGARVQGGASVIADPGVRIDHCVMQVTLTMRLAGPGPKSARSFPLSGGHADTGSA
jgi:hypothetical protein